MAANRLSGQARREARCGAIGRASQRTRGADVPTEGRILLHRGGFLNRCSAALALPPCCIAIKSAPVLRSSDSH